MREGRVGGTLIIVAGLAQVIAACTPVASPPGEPPMQDSAWPTRCAGALGTCDDKPARASAPAPAAASQPAAGQPAPKPEPDAGAAEPERKVATTKTPAASTPDAAAADSGTPALDAGTHDAAVQSSDTPVRPLDAECEYVEVRARSDASGAPYPVPSGESVACFLLDVGFEAPTQALGFSPLIDHPGLVDSITLRTLERSDNHRGAVVSCNDAYPTHQMVAVWAPGADDWYYPKDTGVDLGRGLFLLEVHYLNAAAAAASDQSGMRVCTTQQLRPRTASMSYLGEQHFSIPADVRDYAVSGRCEPVMQTEPIHILRVMPFMNQRGKWATMQVDHVDGSSQLVLDQAFAAGDRMIYDAPATVRVGDAVTSTCYYDNPSFSGVGVGVLHAAELCDFIVLASPAQALNNQSISLWYNSCIDGP